MLQLLPYAYILLFIVTRNDILLKVNIIILLVAY